MVARLLITQKVAGSNPANRMLFCCRGSNGTTIGLPSVPRAVRHKALDLVGSSAAPALVPGPKNAEVGVLVHVGWPLIRGYVVFCSIRSAGKNTLLVRPPTRNQIC